MEIIKMLRPENLGIIAKKAYGSRERFTNAISMCAFGVISPEVTTTASLLPLEPWQIVALRVGMAAFVTGAYLSGVAATLHANEGRTRLQRFLGNAGLAASGVAAASLDVIIVSARI